MGFYLPYSKKQVGGKGQSKTKEIFTEMERAVRQDKEKSQLVKLADGRIAGRIEDDRFIKGVRRSRHMLREPQPSWAIQDTIVGELIRAGVNQIIIYDRESTLEYSIALQDFLEHSFPIDRGYGLQHGCPLSHFQVRGNEQLRLSLWEGEGNKVATASGQR